MTYGTCILCDRQNVEVQQACTPCLVGLVDPSAELQAERTRAEAAEGERDRLREALQAAAQFIYPEVSRGPAWNGWQNTVDMVEAALALPSAPAKEEK